MAALDPCTAGLGVRLLIDSDDQFYGADGLPAALNDPCALAGRDGLRWGQSNPSLRPTVKRDGSGTYLEFAGEKRMEADELAPLFSGNPAHWTLVAIFETTDATTLRPVVALDGGPGRAAFARLRADASAVRGELHVDWADPVDDDTSIPLQINLGGPSSVGPRAGEPNLASAAAGSDGFGWGRKDGGYSTVWNIAEDPTDPETDPNLRRRVLISRSTVAQWTTEEEGTQTSGLSTFATVTLGGDRAATPHPFIGKIYRVAVFDRKLSEGEVRGVEEWLRLSLMTPANCRYAPVEGVRYVAPDGNDTTNLGIRPEAPLATVAKAAPFFSSTGGSVKIRSSESNPYRGEYVHSRPMAMTIEPWPGYDRIWWFGAKGFPDGLTWTDSFALPEEAPSPVGGTVWECDLDSLWTANAIPRSTPSPHFVGLAGPLGAETWSLRKRPGVPRPEDWSPGDPFWDPGQYAPAVGDYGWDSVRHRLYVNLGAIDPNDRPVELGFGYCLTAWRGRLTVRNVNGRYAYTGIFGCGDGMAGSQTPIQGEADYLDCDGRHAGGAGSAFFLRGHGRRLRAYRPVAAYCANDSYGAHRDRTRTEEQRMELYDAVGYGPQDENLSFHEGVSGGAYRFWFWNAGSGNVTCVAARTEPALDARPTSVALVGGYAWDDARIPTDHGAAKAVRRGITFDDPGMRGRVVGCTLDSTVNVAAGTPESYVVRSGNRENVPTSEFTPPSNL